MRSVPLRFGVNCLREWFLTVLLIGVGLRDRMRDMRRRGD